MDRTLLKEHQAIAAALAPALGALLIAAVFGVLSIAWAAAIGLLIAAGAWWFVNRPHPEVREQAVSPAPPVAGLLANLIEIFPQPVLLLGPSRDIVGLNRLARQTLGIGKAGRDLALSLRHPAVLAAVDTVLRGIPAVHEEIALPVPVPRTFILHVTRLPDHNDPTGAAVLLMLHDETRTKRAEQTRADFVANASHELRSPLAALLGMIETLRGPAAGDPEAQSRFLAIMRSEAERMARLIDDLLSLSRVEINEHVPPRERVDVGEILDGIEATLSVRAREREIRFLVRCPDNLPTVMGDADQLTQVFHNLVDNAIKYGRDGMVIEIAVAPIATIPGAAYPGIEVKVTDQGPGIPQVHLSRITERFYRVDAGRSRKLGGTGLGLAIAKHIVNRHRGQLKIESRVGVGSTVSVLLPSFPTSGADDGG